jgi:signal recognition particle GTPase
MWRSQLCKEMLEQGVPTESVIGVMGQVSEKMLEAYKQTTLAAKQQALGIVRANLIAFPGLGSGQR